MHCVQHVGTGNSGRVYLQHSIIHHALYMACIGDIQGRIYFSYISVPPLNSVNKCQLILNILRTVQHKEYVIYINRKLFLSVSARIYCVKNSHH